jgi:hypothetical protein
MRRTMMLLAGVAALAAGPAAARELMGVACSTPAPAHCADSGCTNADTANLGDAVETKSGRKFFLDYPCDLKPNEKVTFVLSLHGGGSIGNWQRHYFPLIDLKEKYRLVIATPSGTRNGWNPEMDDPYLRDIVSEVEGAVGKGNIKAFWLAGHSLGGQTSNRILTTDFFRSRLTGWVSLSGGRLGSKREEVRAPIPTGSGGRADRRHRRRRARRARCGWPPTPRSCRTSPFSHIYETGEHELTAAGLPAGSQVGREAEVRRPGRPRTVVDAKAGYVQDTRRSPTRTRSGAARRGRAARRSTSIRSARAAAWSPTWCAATRATPRASSPR